LSTYFFKNQEDFAYYQYNEKKDTSLPQVPANPTGAMNYIVTDVRLKDEYVVFQFYPWLIILLASSLIWAGEASLARMREQVAKPRGAEERRACNNLS